MIKTKRTYDHPETNDGTRFLVDRIWPRGVKREALKLDDWLKEVAPSDSLRKWFGHDPDRWSEFQKRYYAELDDKPESWQPILAVASHSDVTLVYAARDTEHNNAVALKEYLEKHQKSR